MGGDNFGLANDSRAGSFSLANSARDFSNFSLKTARLELVPQNIKFLQSTHEYASDRATMRYMLFLPNDTIEETKNFLERAQAEWQSANPRDFECAVFHDGEHIGGVSVTLLDGCAELGWCLKKSAQGNGYAQEAAAALIRWANKTFGVTRFIAHCDSENAPSWTTMEKLGMKRVGCTGGRYNKSAPTQERKEFTYQLDIADEWITLERFDMKNIPQVMQVVLPLWAPPSDDKEFVRMDVEFIVRNNIYQPRFSFQLTDKKRESGDEVLSAAFFTLKGDTNDARNWLDQKSRDCKPEQKRSLEMVKTYLEYMDKKALSFMTGDDIKLSLYVSRKRGAGAALLARVLPALKEKGYKNLYLWTDSDCNWNWYVKNGYELVSQEVYEPFSEPGDDYKTFVFRKEL
ncbi:MAG: GNAT family N-acetyltransferase [Treponema sp.]|nr:GNAT family N-acetyltransferase [Treponema sp.]